MLRALLAVAALGCTSRLNGGPPNVVLILADDMGFSDLGCYGGEIATPNLDKLAADGLRFTRFYNTARCWPTRGAALSGYYPQQIRRDTVPGVVNGNRGVRPAWAKLLPDMLKPAGYRSYHSGKWHIDGEPTAAGFDHSYNMTGQDRHCCPDRHAEDGKPLPPVKPEDGYYASTAIADHAIRCLKEHQEKHAGRPFFNYVAFIAPHFPLHAPPEDIARYSGKYAVGWDAVREARHKKLREAGIIGHDLPPPDTKLKPRYYDAKKLAVLGPGEVEFAGPWADLSAEQKRFQAGKMAVHAAMVDRLDREVGRLVDQLKAMGQFENTLILFASDNGADATLLVRGYGHDPAAAMGSPESYLCMGPGWATASNAPFRRHKIWVNEGGISTPLIAHWPKGIPAKGELRHAVGHVIDFVPTALDLAGVKRPLPAGAPPMPGKSLAPAFAADVPIPRDYLFFSHEGNRAIRVGDLKLVSATEDDDRWELFDLAADRGESRDLAKVRPDQARELAALWEKTFAEFTRTAAADQKAKP